MSPLKNIGASVHQRLKNASRCGRPKRRLRSPMQSLRSGYSCSLFTRRCAREIPSQWHGSTRALAAVGIESVRTSVASPRALTNQPSADPHLPSFVFTLAATAAASGIRSPLILSSKLCLKNAAPFFPVTRRMAASSVVPRKKFDNPATTMHLVIQQL